jgi:hypothetical protein
MNFFCSQELLEKWREQNPVSGKGKLHQLYKVLEHGKKYLRKLPEIDRQRYVEGKDEQNNKNDYLLCGLRRDGDLGLSVRFGMPGGRVLPYEGKHFGRYYPGDVKCGEQVSRGRQQGKICRPYEERDSSAVHGEHQGSGFGEIIRIQDAEDKVPGW